MSFITFFQPAELFSSSSNPVPLKPKSGTNPIGTGNRSPDSIPIQ